MYNLKPKNKIMKYSIQYAKQNKSAYTLSKNQKIEKLTFNTAKIV
jgi:hypothetical protein